jgi:phage baseplate assembly protein V
MSEILGDVQKRVAGTVSRGVIADIRHGKRPACRVRIGDITTDWLPIEQVYASKNIASYTPISAGDAVTVVSEAGDLANGRVRPGINTSVVEAPFVDEDTHVMTVSDGFTFQYNQKTHELKISLPAGGKFLVEGDGKVDGHLTVKQLTVETDAHVQGTLSDSKSSIDRLREIFNGHDHHENDSTTDKPNQQM